MNVLNIGVNYINSKIPNNKKALKYKFLILSIVGVYNIIYLRFIRGIDRLFRIRFPYLYAIYVDIQHICSNILIGNGYRYILYYLLLAFYLGSEYVFYSTIIIQAYPLVKYYNNVSILPHYPRLSRAIAFLSYIIYLAAVGICMEEIYSGILNPLWSKFIATIKNKWDGFLNASSNPEGNLNLGGSGGSSSKSPNPGPGDVTKTGLSEDNSKEKKKKSFTWVCCLS